MSERRFNLPIEIETATELQLQVAELGICPMCHTKSLVLRFAGGGYRWNQCSKCRKVVVLDEQPNLVSGGADPRPPVRGPNRMRSPGI